MRTGAILARGSCRVLKWMALVAVAMAVGMGSATAQTPDLTKGGGDGVDIVVRPTNEMQRTEGADLYVDVTLYAVVPATVTTATTVTVTLAEAADHDQVVLTSTSEEVVIAKHSGGAAAQQKMGSATFRVATVSDGGGEDESFTLNVTLGSPFDTTGTSGLHEVMIDLRDTDTQIYTLDRPAADRKKEIKAGTNVNLEFKSTLDHESDVTYSVTTSNSRVATVTTSATVTAGNKANATLTVAVNANAQDGAHTQIVVSKPGRTGEPPQTVADYNVRVGSPAPATLSFTPASQAAITVDAGTAITPRQLPTATGGTAPYTYTATGLPAGLTVAAATGMLSGTPTAAAAATTVTYTATDSATPAATGSLTFTITVMAAGTTPTTATDGGIAKIVIGDPDKDAPVRTIDGTKRVHLTEGMLTKLTITGRWSHAQLATLYAASASPAAAEVTVKVMHAAGNDAWLSPAETDERPGSANFGGKDVVLGSTRVTIPIPAKPTTNVGSFLYHAEKSGTTTLSLPHDLDAENEGFMIVVESTKGLSMSSTVSMLSTVPPVVVIEDDDPQGIVLSTDPGPSTTIADVNLFEGKSQLFKAVAKPAREDLPLQVRYDVTDLGDVSVSSRLYTLSTSGGYIPVGTGTDAKHNVTLSLPANDGNRENEELAIHAEVVSFSLNSGAFDDIDTSTVKFTAVDVHKLPKLTVTAAADTVKEGGEVELTLMIDRNPAETIVDQTVREYTNEEVTVMLDMGTGSSAGAMDFSVPSVKFPERKRGLYTAEMKVKLKALVDDEIDGGEVLVLDAMLKGSEAKNGTEGKSQAAVTTLTIEDGTQKNVYAKTPKEVEDAVYAAKKAAEGADEKFTPGEMIELMGSAVFSTAEGYTASYTAMSSAPAMASVSVRDGTVMVTAVAEGMADITITAHAMSPSGVKILDQTDPDSATIKFPVEVGLEALSIELTGPEDMNLVEGGMGGMVTATANRMVTMDTKVMLMRDRAMSSADDMDYTAEPITILAGQMSGSTMVMAEADDMMENEGNMPEELVLYGMTEGMAGEVTGQLKFYIWDAAVPALPIIAQLLLGGLLAVGGYRRYRRR